MKNYEEYQRKRKRAWVTIALEYLYENKENLSLAEVIERFEQKHGTAIERRDVRRVIKRMMEPDVG